MVALESLSSVCDRRCRGDKRSDNAAEDRPTRASRRACEMPDNACSEAQTLTSELCSVAHPHPSPSSSTSSFSKLSLTRFHLIALKTASQNEGNLLPRCSALPSPSRTAPTLSPRMPLSSGVGSFLSKKSGGEGGINPSSSFSRPSSNHFRFSHPQSQSANNKNNHNNHNNHKKRHKKRALSTGWRIPDQEEDKEVARVFQA
jgi:hypothetical protein